MMDGVQVTMYLPLALAWRPWQRLPLLYQCLDLPPVEWLQVPQQQMPSPHSTEEQLLRVAYLLCFKVLERLGGKCSHYINSGWRSYIVQNHIFTL